MSLEDRVRKSVESAITNVRSRLDEEIQAITQQLLTLAAQEREQASIAARDAALDQASVETKKQVAAAETRMRATLDGLIAEAVAKERKTALDQAAAEAKKQVAEAEARVKGTIDGLIAEAVAKEKKAALEQAGIEAKKQIAEAEAKVRASLDGLVAEAKAKEREAAMADARKAIEAEAEQKVKQAVAEVEKKLKVALSDADARTSHAVKEAVASARAGEREAEMASTTRLLESVRGLDGATSLSEVLDALGLAIGREAARAAVVVLRGERLLGWKLHGFGARDSQPKSIDLSLDESGVMAHAVQAGRSVTTRDGQATEDGPGFAHLPADRMGLAVPVIVGGRVVAVVYADSVSQDPADHPVPSGWPEVIEILTRHAARCLEALTAQKAGASTPSRGAGDKTVAVAGKVAPKAPAKPTTATAETKPAERQVTDPPSQAEQPELAARRFARLLLSDIRLNHEPAVQEGRRTGNLLSRLAPEIERARRLYDARVPASLRSRAELFQQELVATLAGGDASLLGAPA